MNRIDKLHKNHGYLYEMWEEELLHSKDTETYKEIFSSISPNSSSEDEYKKMEKFPIDLIISDMYAPWPQSLIHNTNKFTNDAYYRMANTSGLTVRDHQHSIDLCDAALVTALDLLRPKGSFVCKLFTGVEDKLFEKRVKMVFKKTIRFKPKSSRNESKEVYIIGMDKKEDIDKVEVFTT